MRWEVSGRKAAVLRDAASRIRSNRTKYSSLFFMHFATIQVVSPYSSTDIVTAWKKFRFILSERSDFHMIDNLGIAVHSFAMHMLTSLSVDEILLPRYVNTPINFWGLPQCGDGSFLFKIHEISFICLHIKTDAFCYLLVGFSLGRCNFNWGYSVSSNKLGGNKSTSLHLFKSL